MSTEYRKYTIAITLMHIKLVAFSYLSCLVTAYTRVHGSKLVCAHERDWHTLAHTAKLEISVRRLRKRLTDVLGTMFSKTVGGL